MGRAGAHARAALVALAMLEVDGEKVTYDDQDITILRVEGDTLVPTGRSFGLAGHPASMRGRVTH